MPLISIFTYSQILALFTLALAALTILSFLAFLFHAPSRARLTTYSYDTFLTLIAAIALSATIGALIYQYYYETPVCVLCWWQRIFLFPIGIIALVALRFKERAAHITTAILSLFGLRFALEHYYGHFQIYVQENTEYVMTCDSYNGDLPSCASNTLVEVFGFITIPFMGIVAFIAMLWLCFLAHKAQR